MPSRSELRFALLVAVLCGYSLTAWAQSPELTATGPGPAEIARALDTVKADPNLATDRTIQTLRWRDSTERKQGNTPGWVKWIAGFFVWIAQSARVLVWVAVGAAIGVLVVFLIRMIRGYGSVPGVERFVAPTHVRDLDIRPESLPHDIGAAARALWDRGDHRSSLALLYRGMLSRLAHVHRVPIRDSSTEGDCLMLAARHLTPRRHDYASRLIVVWQRFVYGGQQIPAAMVYALCNDFAKTLNHASVPPAVPLSALPSGGAA